MAGRKFPENVEALAVGFRVVRVPADSLLPTGGGFAVSRLESSAVGSGSLEWLALHRQPAADLAMFTSMSLDVVACAADPAWSDERSVLDALLERITAWQDFMQRGSSHMLGPEAELGLFGELEILSRLLASVPANGSAAIVEAWTGPLRKLHDFTFGSGGLEVKSTSASAGFVADVFSLEQLDDATASPLFVCAVRALLQPSGRTLPEQVRGLREQLGGSPSVASLFQSKLLRAGYLDDVADRYTRRFDVAELRVLPVTAGFQRLTGSTVPAAVRSARYSLDLDLASPTSVRFNDALVALGVIAHDA